MGERLKTTKKKIFKEGSRTYYNSSRFFSEDIRKDVTTLYSFVRVADNLVDSIPQKTNDFLKFRRETEECLKGKECENEIIRDMVDLSRRKNFNSDWIMAFLDSMEMDLHHKKYQTIDETIDYMYGSAEVIGLMMSRILDLPYQALFNARMLGRTMQFINFIRDVSEDLSLGRQYLPQEDLHKFGLETLEYSETVQKKKQFISLMRYEIERFRKWNELGQEGFAFIDQKNLIPVKVATDMYLWTAKKIYKNPFVVYSKKIKPSKMRIILNAFISSRTHHPCKIISKENFGNTLMESEFENARKELNL
ncbi:phytoene/squalene synthase family protein [Cuniculiplasma sp. SKW4]|uniref:phytoene/squalene synthase family protein n=1 Tax=Cuniculiplasma sp. SKW4 TaxID=3400171 RepID=UPI003FD521E1